MVTSSALRRAFGGIALIVSALLAGCSPSPTRPAQVSDGNRKAAPDFALTDINGRSVRLSGYKGMAVLLNFWATWCGPCKTKVPWFNEFEKAYKDRGFEILGVSMDENGWQSVRPLVKQMKVQYPVMIGNDGVAATLRRYRIAPDDVPDRPGRQDRRGPFWPCQQAALSGRNTTADCSVRPVHPAGMSVARA